MTSANCGRSFASFRAPAIIAKATVTHASVLKLMSRSFFKWLLFQHGNHKTVERGANCVGDVHG